MASPKIVPGNTITMRVKLPNANGATGAAGLITGGIVRAFLAITCDNDAVPMAPALDINATYSGANGEWIVQYLGINLTVELFAGKALVYLIITHVSGVRAYGKIKVGQNRPMLMV